MQAHAHSTAVRLEIQKLNELPALPVAAQQFLAAVEDNRMEVRQLAAILERDPGLLARIIGVANSAYYGYPDKVVTAEDAIFKVLGLNAARSLALSIILAGVFDARRCPRFALDRYWEEAISVATLAQRLAPNITFEPAPSPGEAYLAGLLHSIGLLALVHLYPARMGEVFAEEVCGSDLTARERDLVGTDHSAVGAWLGRKWRLPPRIVAAIDGQSRETGQGTEWPLVALTRAARQFVEASRGQAQPAAPDLRSLGVSPEQARQACDHLQLKQGEIKALSRTLAHG